ncbi:hypothetical protein [Bradyrhizobium sp. 1(2017)]|uniref:hypothetical protein n=1 Tax=Bradyrhizobium sp. 1(2017) TaxID=1404888 RepID=UPI00140EBD9F|nr:hypothetical protein [Bradyrhizobium sp. 1(2017)]QIO32313.1 hypothetical protein HAP40_10950 [Bradyrhizobium sp. 1(2017)]
MRNESPPPPTPGHDAPEAPEGDFSDAIFIQPGIRDPNDPRYERIEPEKITPNTVLKPLDIVLYFDKRSKILMQEGVNQQAYVIDDKRALFLRGIVGSISLEELKLKPEALVVRGVPDPIAPYVAKMLLKYRWRPTMFGFATNFIQMHNYAPFLSGELFPPDVSYTTDDEYFEQWSRFERALEPDDALFTFDRQSLLSKVIALGTHGPFSHVAHYIGDKNIWEVVTTGTRIVPLDTYRSRRYRVAAYRNYGHRYVSHEESMAHFTATAGKPGYNYAGAFLAGVRTFFGDKHRSPTTPNGIILSGALTFIDQV